METTLIEQLLADMERGLLERDVPVRLLLLGALAGEHVLLVGPPGTAKSALARRLHQALRGTRYFERLLTRFSVPEELFGPLSLRALEDDRYERLTAGFLPDAEVAFLDEVFRANSAILNTLLTLLNEHEFDNGAGRVRVPLLALVGASNEVPEDEALQAFHDRFLLRVPVAPVGEASFPALLALPADLPPVQATLDPGLLAPLRARAQAVELPAAVARWLVAARAWCTAQGMAVSDRRWRKLVGLLKVQAASRGASAVSDWDLWLLPYVLAGDGTQVAALVEWFAQQVAEARPLDLQWLQRALEAFEQQLRIEQSAPPEDGTDEGAGKIALARAIGGEDAAGDSGLLRLVSERARRRYSRVHVQARLAQVDEVLLRAEAAAQAAHALAGRVAEAGAGHPWLPPSARAAIDAVHAANVALGQALLERAVALRDGFAALPVDEQRAGSAPAPPAVALA